MFGLGFWSHDFCARRPAPGNSVLIVFLSPSLLMPASQDMKQMLPKTKPISLPSSERHSSDRLPKDSAFTLASLGTVCGRRTREDAWRGKTGQLDNQLWANPSSGRKHRIPGESAQLPSRCFQASRVPPESPQQLPSRGDGGGRGPGRRRWEGRQGRHQPHQPHGGRGGGSPGVWPAWKEMHSQWFQKCSMKKIMYSNSVVNFKMFSAHWNIIRKFYIFPCTYFMQLLDILKFLSGPYYISI